MGCVTRLKNVNHPGNFRAVREVVLVNGKCYEIAPLWYIGGEFYKFLIFIQKFSVEFYQIRAKFSKF